MLKTLSALLLLTLPAFGQIGNFGDPAWFGVVATPVTEETSDYTTGLVRWFDAQSMGSNHLDSVASWADKTGNADLTQAAADSRPVYWSSWSGFGNKPAVKLDGTDDYMTVANVADASKTIIIVAQRTNTSVGTVWSSRDSALAQIYSDTTWKYFAASTATSGGQNAVDSGCIVVRYNSLSSADIRGNSGTWVNFDPTDDFATAGTAYFGQSGDTSNWFSGYVGEIRIYDHALSDAQLNQVGAVLGPKWNFTWSNL